MAYKDREKQREYDKERMRKVRQGRTNKVEQGGVEQTRIEFIQQALNDPYLAKGIEAASLRFNDRDARYERAYRYFLWKKGEKVDPAIPYALVEDRTRLEKIYLSLKEFKQAENVYYGCGGVPFDVVGDLLEATK